MTLSLIALGAFVSTMCGGLFAIKWSDRLHLILSFSAGALMSVAVFDLLHEALDTSAQYWSTNAVLVALMSGFGLYMVLDRVFFRHSHSHGHAVANDKKGRFGAGSLSFHSFLDGMAIGVAFHVSAAAGAVATIAVLTHDFSDGINTVSMILRNGGNKTQAFRWLLVDALTPAVGIAVSFLFILPEQYMCLLLAVFSGFFLYIAATDLLPEVNHSHPARWTVVSTLAGIFVIYFAVKLAGV